MASNFTEKINSVCNLLINSSKTVVFSGAGISTSSGIPDFRSERSGLWTKHDPMQVASLTSFKGNPDQFYDWFRPLARVIIEAQPNPAHMGIAQLEKMGLINSVITQNIDELHQRAGSKCVIEMHGSAARLTCPSCGKVYESKIFQQVFFEASGVPECPVCKLPLKPDIVLFEEMLPANAWNKALKQSSEAKCMIVAGSSLEVWPANMLPMTAFQKHGKLIILNYTATHMDDIAEVVIHEDVSKVIPLIVERLNAAA